MQGVDQREVGQVGAQHDQAGAYRPDLAEQVARVGATLDDVAFALEDGRFQEEAADVQAGHQERGRHPASLRPASGAGNVTPPGSDSGHEALAGAAEAEDLLEAVREPAS